MFRNYLRTLSKFAVLVIMLASVVLVVQAGELVLEGELNLSSPQWLRPYSYGDAFGYYNGRGDCSYGVSTQSVAYQTFSFRVLEEGLYHFDLQTASVNDLQILVYGEDHPFTGLGTTGCVAHVDDRSNGASCCPDMDVELQPYIAYTLVVTAYRRIELGEYTVTITGPGEITQSHYFTDGRVNYLDTATPVVVYPIEDGGITVYSDAGERLFDLPEDVANMGGEECPTENTVLYTHDSPYIIVSQLPDCRIQINAAMPNGKTYVLIFLDFAGYYESYEIE